MAGKPDATALQERNLLLEHSRVSFAAEDRTDGVKGLHIASTLLSIKIYVFEHVMLDQQ
jgi:hypothetical protein